MAFRKTGDCQHIGIVPVQQPTPVQGAPSPAEQDAERLPKSGQTSPSDSQRASNPERDKLGK